MNIEPHLKWPIEC